MQTRTVADGQAGPANENRRWRARAGTACQYGLRIGGVLAASLVLGLAARGSTAQQQSQAVAADRSDLQGVWEAKAAYPEFGVAYDGVISYSGEGMVIESFTPQVDGTGMGRKYVFIGAAQGNWQRTGDHQFTYNITWFDYDDLGATVGVEHTIGTIVLDAAGHQFTGPFTDTVRDQHGAVLGTFNGTLSGTRTSADTP